MGARHKHFLTTARLGFGQWSASDLTLAVMLWGDAQVTHLIGGPFAECEIKARLEREIASMKQYGIQYWPMFLLASGELVGCGGLRPYRPEEQMYELGIHLRPRFWGAGLGSEAGRAIIGLAFGEFGAKTLFAGHHPENDRSRRLLEKLGFRFTHTELYPPTGLMHPSYLLRREQAGKRADAVP